MTIAENINQFIDSIDVNPRSSNEYRKALNAFFRFMVQAGHDVLNIRPNSVKDFKQHMQDRNMSGLTIRLRAMVIKRFSRWYAEQGYGVNFAVGIKMPKVYEGWRRMPLTAQQSERLIQSIYNSDSTSMRDMLIINLMQVYGLRDCEISRINFKDIKLVDDEPYMQIKGKGSVEKSHPIPINDRMMDAINDYIVQHRDAIQDDDPVFVTCSTRSRGKRLTPQEVGRIVSRRLKAVGLSGPYYTAHSLRHTAASTLIEKGVDIYTVQVFMRHNSTKVTQLYTRFTEASIIKRSEPARLLSNDVFNYIETLKHV